MSGSLWVLTLVVAFFTSLLLGSVCYCWFQEREIQKKHNHNKEAKDMPS